MKNNNTLAIILAGGRGTRLDILTEFRAKPSVPFAGKYKIIDFVLSCCANSNLNEIGVTIQYTPQSLIKHIGNGKPWNFDRNGEINILPPFRKNVNPEKWYTGTADSIYQNMNYILEKNYPNILILPGDHVSKIDYNSLIQNHIQNDADCSIAYCKVNKTRFKKFGIVNIDNNRIYNFEEKPSDPKSNNASMGIYLFKTKILEKILNNYCIDSIGKDFGRDIIPNIVKSHKVYGFKYDGYWKDVGTIQDYWETSMEILNNDFLSNFNIHTRSNDFQSPIIKSKGVVKNSIISDGAVIKGVVNNSIISPNVIVEEGSIINNSIIFDNTIIYKNCSIEKSIIDKNVIVNKNCKIGYSDDYTKNKIIPNIYQSGINVIGKDSVFPENTTICRNCRVKPYANFSNISKQYINSGSTVE